MSCAESLPGTHWPTSERRSAPRSLPLGRRIRSAFRGAWRAYWRHRAERATLFMLQSLDERTLKDIGIDRSEIVSVVYGARDRRLWVCRRP